MLDPVRQILFARDLRRNATAAERAIWGMLSRLRPRFTRQYPIGPYVADFACRRARLIVEVDGSQHAESERDSRRITALEADGWIVLRYWNNEVLADPEGVAEDLIAKGNPRLPPDNEFTWSAARSRKKEPPPTPPANAGGE